MGSPDGSPVISFETSGKWESWLAKNHGKLDGLWLKIFKKGSGRKTVTYAQALDAALCYGWIDGRKNGYDEKAWLQKFTPRRSKSPWSKINTRHAERLIKAGRMKGPGLKAVEEAKKDGRWKAAYDSPGASSVSEDFLKALAGNKKAGEFFKTLNKANTYAIAYRLQTAKKPETREKRIAVFLGMLAKGKKLHP